ncbi:pituitary tumor-transforming gene 1 protein-interacting protein-like [Theristicus caerulescens]
MLHRINRKDLVITAIIQARRRILSIFTCSRNLHSPRLPLLVQCLWCASSGRCVEYPVRRVLPPADLCELRSARWGVCWVNFEALIIAMSVVGGTILIMVGVCCCCCCKKKSKKQVSEGFPVFSEPDKDDERAAREREKRRVRQEERRAEMKSRHDEIRRKYGLFKEENPYAKFEN